LKIYKRSKPALIIPFQTSTSFGIPFGDRFNTPGKSKMKKIIITAADGYPLSVLYLTPVEETDNTIILSSATGVKKEFYINFAQFLTRKGYNVLLFDYRGIGGSAPNDLRNLKCFMHEWATMDMNAALNFVISQKNKTKIIWLGHSIGGQMVPLLDEHMQIKKLITVNAALGYWKYFPYPHKILIWCLWYIIQPIMIRCYGYGNMKKIGWGENLPPNVLNEWKKWCTNPDYFMKYLKASAQQRSYDDFTVPITALYSSDDYIANDKTVAMMMKFYPKAPAQIKKLDVKKYTDHKVGHTGIFRKKFESSLWPLLLDIIEEKDRRHNSNNQLEELYTLSDV
jgi:predicted alpha/beta hydrolase